MDRHAAAALLNTGDLVLQFGEIARAGVVKDVAGPDYSESRSAAESAQRFYTRSMEIFQALAKIAPNDCAGPAWSGCLL